MYDLAKSARDKMKSKARMLAGAKDQKVDSSDWSPAEPLNADVKTGMRPVGKSREYKAGGVVAKARADRKPRKAGGRAVEKEIGVGMANKDMKAANEQREGKKHIGGMKKGGRTKKNIGGVMEKLSPAYGLLRAAERGGRDEERDTGEQMKGAMMANLANRKDGGGVKDKKALGGIDPSPKRGAAGHYKKGGRTKKADGGIIDALANALAGRGYIDGSSWMDNSPAEEKSSGRPMELAGAKMTRVARPSRHMSARKVERLSPEQGSREMAMAYENEQPTIRGSVSPVQSESFMKKGGKVKRADGGYTGGNLPSPKEGLEAEGAKVKERPISFSKAQKQSYDREEGYSAADRAAGRKKGGRAERKAGGRAKGKGKTHINIMINAGRKEPQMPAMPPAGGPDGGGVMPVPMPPAAAAPPPAMPPMPMPPPPMGGGMPPMPPGRKAGGRITKVASSYKDMEAGAVSGEGRLQKTDIAKKHHGAPTRKTGGRAVKSYRDMTAGSESGSGRLQKTEMEKSQRLRGH